MNTSVQDSPTKFWSCYFISTINMIAISFFLFFGILTNFLFLFRPKRLSKNLTPLLFGFLFIPFILKMIDAFLIHTQLEKEKQEGSSVIFFAFILFVILQILILSNRKFQKILTVMINNLKRIIVELE